MKTFVYTIDAKLEFRVSAKTKTYADSIMRFETNNIKPKCQNLSANPNVVLSVMTTNTKSQFQEAG